MRSRLASRGGAGADDDDDAEAAAAAAPLRLLRPWRRCCCCCANLLLLLLLLPLPLPLLLLTSPAVDHRLRCCRRGFEGSRGRDGTRRGYSKSCEASTALRPRCLTGQRGACTRRVPAQAKSRSPEGGCWTIKAMRRRSVEHACSAEEGGHGTSRAPRASCNQQAEASSNEHHATAQGAGHWGGAGEPYIVISRKYKSKS